MRSIDTEIATLDRLSTGDLAQRYAELHGQPCRTRHRAYLIRKIAWRIQANAEGDLTERARRRAAELADDAEIRVMAPRALICPPQNGEAEIHAQLLAIDRCLPDVESRIADLEDQTVTQADARSILCDFDKLWATLIPREQARLLKLLISTVEYDGEIGTVSVTFRPTSIRSLINRKEEAA